MDPGKSLYCHWDTGVVYIWGGGGWSKEAVEVSKYRWWDARGTGFYTRTSNLVAPQTCFVGQFMFKIILIDSQHLQVSVEILHHHQDFNSHLKTQNLATLGPYLFTVTAWSWGAVAPLGPSPVLQIDTAPTSSPHPLSSLPAWCLWASELLLLMNGNYFRFYKADGQIWKSQSY